MIHPELLVFIRDGTGMTHIVDAWAPETEVLAPGGAPKYVAGFDVRSGEWVGGVPTQVSRRETGVQLITVESADEEVYCDDAI